MPINFTIPHAEYEERRQAFELCTWINSKLAVLRASGHFDQVYFDRRSGTVKRLIEEAIPVSRLGLYLSTPESVVHIRCFADSRNYDAEIEITGFATRSFKLEVTTAETDDSTMRRQALARNGMVHLTGSVHRDGRQISSDGEMVDVADEEGRIIARLLQRLKEKVSSSRYDNHTAVLVYASEFRSVGPDARADLVRDTTRYLLESEAALPAVYYCFWPDYSIVHVQPANHRH